MRQTGYSAVQYHPFLKFFDESCNPNSPAAPNP